MFDFLGYIKKFAYQELHIPKTTASIKSNHDDEGDEDDYSMQFCNIRLQCKKKKKQG